MKVQNLPSSLTRELKMCVEVDSVVHCQGSGREKHFRVPYRSVKWGVDPPSSFLEGIGQGLGVVGFELAEGFYDLFASPLHGAKNNGVKGVAEVIILLKTNY